MLTRCTNWMDTVYRYRQSSERGSWLCHPSREGVPSSWELHKSYF